jgi:hypothetical protein
MLPYPILALHPSSYIISSESSTINKHSVQLSTNIQSRVHLSSRVPPHSLAMKRHQTRARSTQGLRSPFPRGQFVRSRMPAQPTAETRELTCRCRPRCLTADVESIRFRSLTSTSVLPRGLLSNDTRARPRPQERPRQAIRSNGPGSASD